MPRGLQLSAALLASAVVACSLEVNFAGSRYACPDGECPSGYECRAGFCEPLVDGPDAANDGPEAVDAGIDAEFPVDSGPDAQVPCAAAGGAVVDPTSGYCYTLHLDGSSWVNARTACAALVPTAHLVVITDTFENVVVASLDMPGDGLDAWMGASDLAAEGNFVWVDATPFVFDNWRAGEPNNGGADMIQEDCAVMELDLGGSWDDRSCTSLRPYLCERP